MTRIAPNLLVQHLPGVIVVSDESTGDEVEVPIEAVGRLIGTLQFFYGDFGGGGAAATEGDAG